MAKYIFRGLTAFEFNPETKTLTAPDLDLCGLISNDYLILSAWFDCIYQYMETGKSVFLETVEVD